VAFGALATEAHGTTKEMALGATTFADEPLAAAGALVDRLCDHRTATLELSPQLLQIWQLGVMTEAESALLMGA
jgi:hypothetical protein